MGRHVAHVLGKGNMYWIFIDKTERKRPLGLLRLEWVNDIKMNLKETWWEYLDWIHLAQDRNKCQVLLNMLNELSGSVRYQEIPLVSEQLLDYLEALSSFVNDCQHLEWTYG
jgi:hypothetical protein